jgi:endonuclease YncB( thermonuclease family)
VTGGVAPGWYPDYEAPPGHQRYWNGDRWTARRRSGASPRRPRVRTLLAILVLVGGTGAGVGAFALAEQPPPADPGRPPSSAPPSTPDRSTVVDTPAPRLWKVGSVIDAMTLKLSSGARVRLAGVADGCAPIGLGELVVGEWVSLERGGPDKDAAGRLVRYVDLEGVDVGRRLIQRGWARAGDEPNPRRAIYRRIDERSPDVCP